MRHRALTVIAHVWIVGHLLGALGTPLVVWASTAHLEAGTCECGHGPGAVCPMHSKPARKGTCTLRSAASASTLGLPPVIAGFPPEILARFEDVATITPTRPAVGPLPFGRLQPPDPPPPRI